MAESPSSLYNYPSKPLSWNERDVLLFANSIGCEPEDGLHYLYVRFDSSLPSPILFKLMSAIGTPPQLLRLPDLSHRPHFQTRLHQHGIFQATFYETPHATERVHTWISEAGYWTGCGWGEDVGGCAVSPSSLFPYSS